MPTRSRKSIDPPEPRRPADDEEEPIEILEVVGVDETTGAVKPGAPEESRAPHAPSRPREGPGRAHRDDPAAGRELDEALRDKEKYYDLLLRKQAEFENFRKRMERERDETWANATRDVVKRLLPVLDNMERALRASEGSKNPLFQGIELVRQQFLDLLKKEGVVPIEALGAKFDPRLHEAVEVMDVPGLTAETILEEMQKGYLYNERLLRPALVKVASGRAPGQAAPSRHDEAGEDS